MITVVVLINGQPIYTRSARNQGERNENDETKYKTDCGHVIWHKREDGFKGLAKKMIDCGKEI